MNVSCTWTRDSNVSMRRKVEGITLIWENKALDNQPIDVRKKNGARPVHLPKKYLVPGTIYIYYDNCTCDNGTLNYSQRGAGIAGGKKYSSK